MKKAKEAHRFFVTESPRYMQGAPRARYLLQYPFAYCLFMFYTLVRS